MLKISDFSKLSRISIRMLRFYDERDILKPSIVKENGYRYYHPKQLLIASRIVYLRDLGFKTSQIKSILKIYHDNQEINRYLLLQLEELKEERNEIDKKISAITRTIEKLNKEDMMMSYEVMIKEISSKYMMCKRNVIPSYEKEGLLWNGLYNELKECQIDVQMDDNALALAVFYDKGYKEKDVDVEIRVEVKGKYEDTENIHFRQIPATKVASVTFHGDYHQITEVSYSIAQWLSQHHYETTGPIFTIYHVGYAQTQDTSKFITEICYPIG